MKYKLFKYAFVIVGLIVFAACESYDDLFPKDTHHVLTVKNFGTTSVPLYTVIEQNNYNIVVLRGGSDPSGSISGNVNPMSAQAFAEYCNEWNLNYTILPEGYYSLENSSMIFNENDSRYKNVTVSFSTAQIKELQDQNIGVEYALPLLLNSNNATVRDSMVILLPNVIVPELGFENPGYKQFLSFTSEDEGKNENISIPISLPMENDWEFTCKVEIDKDAFENFKSQNVGRYNLLEDSYYTLDNGGEVGFTPGESISSLGITVKCPDGFGEYILPLSITSCSRDGFDLEARKTIFVGINRNLPSIPLSIDMLSANSIHPENDGTGLYGLFDGRGSGKHFHSNWWTPVGDPTYGNYIQINLKEPIQSVSFNYYTRFENANGAPTMIEIFISNDGDTWESLALITSNLPDSADALYSSQIYSAEHEFSYFRFCVLTSKAGDCRVGSHFNLGEFELFGK